MNNISVERIWQDQDFYEIRVTAQSEYMWATTDIYISDISDLADNLEVYPQNKPEYHWQAYENNHAGKNLSFRVFPKDKLGHLLVEVVIIVEDKMPADQYHCCFCIETEIGLLNSFGKRLHYINRPNIGTKVELNNLE